MSFLQSSPVVAQLSPSDSTFFNAVFTEQLFVNAVGFPGNWYVHDTLHSTSEMFSQLDSIFIYSDTEFNGCYKNIKTAADFYYDTLLNVAFNYYYFNFNTAYLQTNPLIKLPFELNEKKSTAFATYTPSTPNSNCDIAFLVIPGSNSNQTSEINRGSGYHNINCYVKYYLKQLGDVFVLCKPLEDYRALQWNGKKFNSADYVTPGNNSFVYEYLSLLGKPYGINYLIEAMAYIKLLNQKYKKVVLLGCSQGGYAALVLSLNSPVDAALISSGYTVHFDSSAIDLNALRKNFDTIPFIYNREYVKKAIDSSLTQYLFSWPDSDSKWYQMEHDSFATETYFDSLDNCTYYYDYTHHSFPPCQVLDTFAVAVSKRLKAKFLVTDASVPDSLITEVSFCGTTNYAFDLYRDTSKIQTYFSINAPLSITLKDTGTYYIKNLVNTAGQKGYCTDTIVYKLDAPLFFPHLEISQSGNVRFNNPFTDQLKIFINNNDEILVEIFDLTGKPVSSRKTSDSSVMLDTHLWNSGIYFLKLSGRKTKGHYKLLKI